MIRELSPKKAGHCFFIKLKFSVRSCPRNTNYSILVDADGGKIGASGQK